MRRIETLKEGERAVGICARVKVVKNKVASPFGVAEFDIDFGRGISRVGCVLDLAVREGVVKGSGAHFAYGEQRLGQGRAKVKAALEELPGLVEEIAGELRGGRSTAKPGQLTRPSRPSADLPQTNAVSRKPRASGPARSQFGAKRLHKPVPVT